MKKILVSVAVATALVAGSVNAEPTRGFVLETAKTAADNVFSIDLVNTANGVNQIRFGAFDGEVLINPTGGGNGLMVGGTTTGSNPSAGYKRAINDMFAVFGMLGLSTRKGTETEFMIGGAFSGKAEQLNFSVNASLGAETKVVSKTETVFSVGAGAYVPLEASGKMKHFMVGGELYVSNRNNSNVGFGLGGRWAPRDTISIDVLLLADPETKAVDAFFATPATVRANLAF